VLDSEFNDLLDPVAALEGNESTEVLFVLLINRLSGSMHLTHDRVLAIVMIDAIPLFFWTFPKSQPLMR
jgi:hypothetical protein